MAGWLFASFGALRSAQPDFKSIKLKTMKNRRPSQKDRTRLSPGLAKKGNANFAFRSLFCCLFLLVCNSLFSQSLYQDAKALAEMIHRQKSEKESKEKIWFRVREICPYEQYGFFSGARVAIDNTPGTFKIDAKPNYQSIVKVADISHNNINIEFRRSNDDSLLWSEKLIPGLCGIEIKENIGEVRLFVPRVGEKNVLITNYGNVGYYIEIKDAKLRVIDVFGGNIFMVGQYISNQVTLDREGVYYFDELKTNDTIHLFGSGKQLFTLYREYQNVNIDNRPSEQTTSSSSNGKSTSATSANLRRAKHVVSTARYVPPLVLMTEKDTITLDYSPLYCINRSDSIIFYFAPYPAVWSAYKKSFPKPNAGSDFTLALSPYMNNWGWQVSTRPKSLNNGGGWENRWYSLKHWVIDSLEYQVIRRFDGNDESRTLQVAFYRGNKFLDTIGIQRYLTIGLNDAADKIDVLVGRYPTYDSDEISAFQRTIALDAQKISFEGYKGSGRIQNRRFEFYQYDEQNERWRKSESSILVIDNENTGWYQIRFSSVGRERKVDFYEYPRFVNNTNDQAEQIPVEWDPFVDSTFDIIVHNGRITLNYTAAFTQEPRTIFLNKKDKLPTLLGTHSQIKETDRHTSNLWGDISAKYRSNPFLGRTLRGDLAKNFFDEAPGLSNAALKRRIAGAANEHYPWQKVVFENGNLEMEQQVSYEEVVNTYRTPITTASDNLQAASEQFGSESKKLRRGLSTADLAAGLSDFIVERAQEELNVTFLDRMRTGILNDTAEFSILFPQTRKMLGEFKIVQYRTLLDFAKNAFVLDLRNLGVSFPKLFSRLTKYQKINNDPKVYNIFLLYDIANKVYEGMPVDTVLLHVHNRLHERRTNLGKSINERMATTLKNNVVVRDSLLRSVIRYDSLLKVFDEKRGLLIHIVHLTWYKFFLQEDSLSRLKAERFIPVWEELDAGKREYKLVMNNLKGNPDYEYVLERLPFNTHQAFFARPPDTLKTISAGLELSRNLLNPDKMGGYFDAIRNIEDKLVSMDSLRRELNAEQAKKTLKLSNYIPTFERLIDVLYQRACLELALVSELALDKKYGFFREHDRQSLIYLQQVLRSPEKYGQFDWGPIDSFNVKLVRAGMDTCTVCNPFENNPSLMTICRLSTISHNSFSDTLSTYSELRKLVAVVKDIEVMNTELDKAGTFLNRIEPAIKDRFIIIAQDTAQWDVFKKRDTIITEYNKQFVFSKEITEGALAFHYGRFVKKIKGIIEGDTLAKKKLPELEIRKSGRLDSGIQDIIIEKYDKWVQEYLTYSKENPARNAFLDYYNKHWRIFDVTYEDKEDIKYIKGEINTARKLVDSLGLVSIKYRDYLNSLQNRYAGDLVESLRQTEAFATLTEITLQWLYAFQDGSEERDSVVVRDSTVQHIKRLTPDGREISYDTLVVKEWKVDSLLSTRRWITPQQFNAIMEDTLLRKAWLGLLYQRLSAIEGGPKYDARSMALLATKFINTIYGIDDQRELLQYKKRNNQTLHFEDYYPFIRSSVDMLNIVLETPVGDSSLQERFCTLQDVPVISNEVLSMFENIFAENYANVIRNVVQLLSIAWELDEPFAPAANRCNNASKWTSPKRSKTALRRNNNKVKSSVLLYGSFMANMVGAQTPDHVKAAIRAVATPPGSSSLKRNAAFNMSLNGYLGAGFHVERLRSAAISDDERTGATLGLSVPIGLTASWGNLGRKGWSVSVFAPLFDIGAVTAYRLDQKNVDAALPELSFGNLIAPGAYFLANVPRSPFTFGAGVQFGPQTRKITLDGTEQTSGAWRFGVVAAIDVPIFNIFTRQ